MSFQFKMTILLYVSTSTDILNRELPIGRTTYSSLSSQSRVKCLYVGVRVCVCVRTAKANHACLLAGSQEDSEDKSGLIVAIVIGLLVLAAIVGVAYWFYMRNSRCGKENISICMFAFVTTPASAACACELTAHFERQ